MPTISCVSAFVDGFALEESRADGTEVYILAMEGWEEGPDLDVSRVGRSGHGEFAIPGRMSGRVVTIEGRAKSPDHLSSMQLRREMGSILSTGGFGDLTIQHSADLSLAATVQRLGRPTFVNVTGKFFDWRLSLLAPDPYRYGATQMLSTTFATDPEGRGLRYPAFSPSGVMYYGPPPESDGTVTVTNYGNAPARPIFYVDGPGPVGGFSILDLGTGRRITYLGALPAGSSLVLDSSDGSVVIDGTADRRGDTIVTGWPEVAPGASVTFRFAPEASTSAAVMTVLLRSTYY